MRKNIVKILAGVSTAAMMMTGATCIVMADDNIKIGVSMDSQDSYNTQREEYYTARAEELGNVDITFTNAASDATKQVTDVETLIAQNVDVIVLKPVDIEAALPVIDNVKDKGIYLIIDTADPATDKYDVRISGEQSDLGKVIGEYIQTWLDEDESRTVTMGYINGASAEILEGRETGIYETCTSDRLKTVAHAICDWDSQKAMSTAEDWMLAYPEMNCIACANDEMAIGVVQAAVAAGKDMDNFLVFGVDGTEAAQEYIRSGEMKATAYQDSKKEVEVILDVATGLVNGETYEKVVNPDSYAAMTIDTIDELLAE